MQLKLTLIAAALLTTQHSAALANPLAFVPVAQANEYHDGINIYEYWQSEKLDGIRAIWNGKQLLTRNGNPIYAPRWFTDPLPDYALEGELWAGRGHFALVQQTVLDHTPSDEAWRKIDFMLFDMPDAAGDYTKRYYNLIHVVDSASSKHIKYIEHTPVLSEQELLRYLDTLVNENGEGIMLRKVTARYQAGRSNDLLKLKKHQDAEARVVGYKIGNGKYKGLMGSVLVRTDEGTEFYVGTGFSDEQRLNPPEIGSLITYRYNGLTAEGKPRFARFVRVREIY
ncbi:DNA ligase [Vibrio fluvialis]|jgi:DNA ligase-1|uniref:DNA ligase n=2 Tax=Vibrio fluvialis TaxID=676 RepID=A0AAX2LND5_VIBFL|nr:MULTISPECIES: DNA ligase [Vibrio]TNF12346.1 MAG: DNA ligase [Vibrionaceae bacterium]HDM8033106.1 DNA ligase [Vibrio fluvialis clinical-1]AMF94438.1 DNA ligase [Vibrio fluvialis]EKO3377510.1 DNA ligase [Vibrio fluvialis]EKO3384622.1 DNA ligase [Vibrio fluvialis]